MTPSTPATTDAGALADVTDEMLVAAMRTFEPMSSVLRYREKDKWHSCDMMGMRDAIRAALTVAARNSAPQETRGDEPVGDQIAGDALLAVPQQSPRLEREALDQIAQLTNVTHGDVLSLQDALHAIHKVASSVTSTSHCEVGK